MPEITIKHDANELIVGLGSDAAEAARQAGLATAAANAASASAANFKHQAVVLTHTNAAEPNGGRTLVFSAPAGTEVPGDLANTVFTARIEADKGIGGASVTITGKIGETSFVGKDGSGIPEGRWLDGDTITFVRASPSGPFQLISVNRPNSAELVYASEAEGNAGTETEKPINPAVNYAVDQARDTFRTFGHSAGIIANPGANSPVRLTMLEAHRMFIDIRPQNGAYRGFVRQQSDLVRWEWMNIRDVYHPNQSAALWTPNALWTRFEGREVEHMNHVWNTLVGGNTNVGHLPSTLPAVQFGGDTARTVAEINNGGGSGPYHGNINAKSFQLTGTGVVLNATALTDGVNLATLLKRGDVLFADSLVLSMTSDFLDPVTGTAFAAVSESWVFNPASGYQVRYLPTIVYGTAKVTFGYIGMYPNQWGNRARHFHNVSGVATETDIEANGTYNLANAGRVQLFNNRYADRAAHRIELANLYAPFRRNGVSPAMTGLDPIVVTDSEKRKLYFPTHQGSTDTDTETGNTITGLIAFDGVLTNGS